MPQDLSNMDTGYAMLLPYWTNPLALSNQEIKGSPLGAKITWTRD